MHNSDRREQVLTLGHALAPAWTEPLPEATDAGHNAEPCIRARIRRARRARIREATERTGSARNGLQKEKPPWWRGNHGGPTRNNAAARRGGVGCRRCPGIGGGR